MQLVKKSHPQTLLNTDPCIAALERALQTDGDGLRIYRNPISELIREVKMARARIEKVDMLEAKLRRAEERIDTLMHGVIRDVG